MSLRNLLKQRISEHVIEEAKSKMKKKYSLLVGDNTTIRILHHCFKMHELNDMNIGVVVNITFPRERVRLSPIYFLTGHVDSVRKLVEDYQDTKNPRYGAPVHAFFVSPLEPRSLELLKNSNLVKKGYLGTCEELRCDFLVLEQKVFSFDRDEAFSTLYFKEPDVRGDELDRTAQQLVGVCLTANEQPYVRYSGSSRSAKDLAQLVVKRFHEMASNLPSWKPEEEKATILILDRADDPLSPLLHPMTFQAIVHDLLGNQITTEPVAQKNSDEKEDELSGSKENLLTLPTEDDKVWAKYRHMFIGEVNKRLPKEFTEWRNESAVVKFKDKKGGDGMSNADLMKAAQDMPQYQQQIRRFKVNLDLAQAVTKKFADQKLLDVILLEQDIACWIDADGKKCDRDKLANRCSQDVFLNRDSKSKELKLRLFMAYLISQGGLSDMTRKTLMEHAGFTERDQNIIMNLSAFQVPLSSAKPPKEGHKNSEYWSAVQKAAKTKSEQSSEESSPIRFMSYLEWAITNHLENTEGKFEEHFPYTAEKPSNTRSRKKTHISLRREKDRKPEKPSGPRLIVYVLGGVTYSELCSCYELGEKHNTDIFVGSTSILSPQKYLQLLSQKRVL